MARDEGLPGRWLELRLAPPDQAAAFGPTIGWLAGVLAAGGAPWSWARLGIVLLGLVLVPAVWARLWALMGEFAAPPRPAWEVGPAAPPVPTLPYTAPGSLSARLAAALARGRARLRALAHQRGGRWIETAVLAAMLLVATLLWGGTAPLVGGIGLALLVLRRLVHRRPLALTLLRALGGLAWPWWLGHTAWAQLTGDSLLLSILWGLAYAGWSELAPAVQADPLDRPRVLPVEANPGALWWAGLPQAAVLVYFLVAGRPLVGAACGLLLLGQVLVQAALVRSGRWGDVARGTWPQAALGVLLSGLALGGMI